MEPTSSLVTALAAKSGEAAIDVAKQEARGFLKQLFGPSAEAIGEEFALRHRERLFNNLVDVLARAKKRLNNAGLSVREVPPKIIHPLLEAAMLEEDEDMREMWSSLLAGAAQTGTGTFYAAYVSVLKQLSTEEARFLKQLYEVLVSRLDEYHELPSENQQRHPLTRIGNFEELSVMFCAANGVLEEQRNDYTMGVSIGLENLARLGVLKGPAIGKPTYGMGTFGIVFLELCAGKQTAAK